MNIIDIVAILPYFITLATREDEKTLVKAEAEASNEGSNKVTGRLLETSFHTNCFTYIFSYSSTNCLHVKLSSRKNLPTWQFLRV